MTSEHSNIVNLRDALPPLQENDTVPATMTSAPRRNGMPFRDKAIFVLILAGIVLAYVGHTNQWPNLFISTSSTSDGGVQEPTLQTDPPAPPQPDQQINPPSTPSRDVLYSINVREPASNHEESGVGIVNPRVEEATGLPVVAEIATPSQSAAPMSTPISPRITAASASNDLTIAYQNQARIEAIEGYIVEMLTVIESQKTELASVHALLEKNSAAIDQQIRHVNTLLQARTATQRKTPIIAKSQQITLPFRVMSIRQFGETLSIRIENATSSKLLVLGQRHAGWELVRVDTDHRQAEFLHIDSRARQVASL